MPGKAFIFSAPSGAGKTTIVKRLLSELPQLSFSISATTRNKREGVEQDGVDYYFLSIDDFKSRISKGDFYEWEEVYPKLFYGTLKSEVERIWKSGKHVIFDIDVVGGINLKKEFSDRALSVFVKVKDLETLKERLSSRNTETTDQLNVRLKKAQQEMQRANEFDYILVNENLDDAVQEIKQEIIEFIDRK
ncbi:MAG: guanylate kinase [Bacteroidota bacterium]